MRTGQGTSRQGKVKVLHVLNIRLIQLIEQQEGTTGDTIIPERKIYDAIGGYA